MLKKSFKKRYFLIASIVLAALGIYLGYIHQFEVLPLPAYYLLQSLPEPKAGDTILVVSPHPDDEALGAAGFIKRAHDRGAVVEVVIATDGNKHGLKMIRREETMSAMAILGIDQSHILFLDYPDSNLKKFSDSFSQKLATMIDDFQPSIILSTHPADTHPDHTTVGQVVDRLVHRSKRSTIVYQYLVHYHRYPRPEGFQPTSFLLPPVRLISVTQPWLKFDLDVEEQTAKNEAILQYKSQLTRKNPLLRGLLLSFIRQNELFVAAHQ